MVMAPTQQTDNEPDMSPMPAGADTSNTPTPPAQSGSDGEPDMSPSDSSPAAGATPPSTPGTQGGNPNDQDAQTQQITQALQQKIASLSPEDQKFLQVHMTSEFVKAMGLINGPVVEQYLQKFVDPNKVMVPIPRQAAEQLAQQQAQKMKQGGGAQPPAAPAQGATPPSPPPAQGASPATSGGGMMAPPGN